MKLPDVEFVISNKEQVLSRLLEMYRTITGRRLAEGDPVRIFILFMANVVVLLLNRINETGKQNMLRYAIGGNLDNIGILVGVARGDATAATTKVKFTLSASQPSSVIIPRGTRVTAGDNIFFALDDDLVFLTGETQKEGEASCTTLGEKGNGYAIGELTTLVDPSPYVATVSNITTSQGGATVEDDERYRERIQKAPEKFSCAGPSGAYEFYAKAASNQIEDVTVISPAAGEVMIYPLLKYGELPQTEILEKVKAMCNQTHIRPLTDKVNAKAPSEKKYNIQFTYYINRSQASDVSLIQQNVNKAMEDYIIWQRSMMGRDINPSELIKRVMEAGAKRVVVTSPVYTKVKNGSSDDGFVVEIATVGTKNGSYGGLEDE